jgi:hypothetical protein
MTGRFEASTSGLGSPALELPIDITVDLTTIRPTRTRFLDPTNLYKLMPFFVDRTHDQLDPIVIVRDPEMDELLLHDGNNRLALAVMHNVQIPYKVYSIGDVHKDSVGELPIDERLIEITKISRRKAKERGYNDFDKFLRDSLEAPGSE